MGCGTSSSQMVSDSSALNGNDQDQLPPRQSVILEDSTFYFQAGSGHVEDISKQQGGSVDIFSADGQYDAKFGEQQFLELVKKQAQGGKQVSFVVDCQSYEVIWLIDNFQRLLQLQEQSKSLFRFILIVTTLKTGQYYTGPAGFQYNFLKLLGQVPKKNGVAFVERGAFYQADEKQIVDSCQTKLNELFEEKSLQDGQRVCFYPDGKQLYTDLVNTVSQINSRSWKKKFYSHVALNENSDEVLLLQGMQRVVQDLVKDIKGNAKILQKFGQLPPKALYFQSVPPKQKLIVQIGTSAITLKRFLTGKKVNLQDIVAADPKFNTELLFVVDQNSTIEDLVTFKKILEQTPIFKAVVFLFSNNTNEWASQLPVIETILNKADIFIPLNVENPKNGEFLKALTGTSICLTEIYYHLVCNTKINMVVPIFEAQSLFKTSKNLEIQNQKKNILAAMVFGSNDVSNVSEKQFSSYSAPAPVYRVPSMTNGYGIAFSNEIIHFFSEIQISKNKDNIAENIRQKWNHFKEEEVNQTFENFNNIQKEYTTLLKEE